jgi:hypothetical protein
MCKVLKSLLGMSSMYPETVKVTYVQPGTYAPGEVPEYAFCEISCAGPRSKWHIRKIKGQLWLGGGIDTPSLCGYVKPFGPAIGDIGGWDVNVKITERHLGHACPECVEKYREALNGT